ncbi:hypothetical protein NXS19_013463 [Fusarium pseudograminearum]|nr:hypothetical protein NXS19_013463 [Fusarium pseudograminearum]
MNQVFFHAGEQVHPAKYLRPDLIDNPTIATQSRLSWLVLVPQVKDDNQTDGTVYYETSSFIMETLALDVGPGNTLQKHMLCSIDSRQRYNDHP